MVFYVYLLDEITVLIQFLKDFRSMITVEITGVDHALHEISRSAIGLPGIPYLREV